MTSSSDEGNPQEFIVQRRPRWQWVAAVGGAVVLVVAIVAALTLRDGGDSKEFTSSLKIAYATSTPAQKAIIEYVNKEIAPDYGISLEAVGYGDGDAVYRSVDEHETAGHFTAHRYWTEEVNKKLGTHNFATDAEIYTWVGAVYSAKFRNLADIPDGAAVSICLLYTSPSPRDRQKSRMPSSA